MLRTISLSIGSFALALAPTTVSAASFGYNLRLTVPVHCSVHHQGGSVAAPPLGGIALGTFQEYCNAPGGYELVVSYTPGSLRGARIIAGDDEVRLDGSGYATLSRASGPRKRQRTIAAIPGEHGFDTDRLDLQIIPTV